LGVAALHGNWVEPKGKGRGSGKGQTPPKREVFNLFHLVQGKG